MTVTVYMKPDCPYSRALVRFLQRKKRIVTEINVLENKFQFDKMVRLAEGHPWTPVWIEENGTVNVGFHGQH